MLEKRENFTVCKFGGSSLADGERFRRVKNLIRADAGRKIIVVSAPGKRFIGDEKVTDLLYALNAATRLSEGCDEAFDLAFGRYYEIKKSLGLKIDISKELNHIKLNLIRGEDYIVSRGEYLCALFMAEYLGFDFIDAAEVFYFDKRGLIDEIKTENAVKRLPFSRGVVVPGFYGVAEGGKLKLFSRGGSDVSGALIAAYSGADVYENWTDVSGVYLKDPNAIKGQKPIEKMTYDELMKILSCGAQVVHAGAVSPLKKAGVKMRILNTFRPEDEGTTVK